MRHHRLVVLVALLLILATVSVFWQVRKHEFINLDDNTYVTKNPHVQAGLTWNGFVWAFTTTHTGNWHPLTWISHMLDFDLYGLRPGGHHLTNVLLHVLNTVMILVVLTRMSGAVWPSAFVAALFALHPLHVESVAWAAERKDVLSTFFGMLTLWTYVRYVEHPGPKRYILVSGSFALGLMSKPMLVTLPFVLLLLDYWPLGRLTNGQRNVRSRQTRQSASGGRQRLLAFSLVQEKLLLFALAAASSVVTFFVQQKGGAVMPLDVIPLKIRIANSLVSYVRYMGKTIWPDHLAVFYPHPAGNLPMWQTAGAISLLVCISFLVIRAARQCRYLAVGWLWYLGTLVPVIGVVQVGGQSMADRYTYVPLIGLFIIIAWGASDLAAKWRYGKTVLAVSAGILLLACSVRTWYQVRLWHESLELFKHTLKVTSNNYLINNNLGNALAEQGRLEEAIAHYSEALKISPSYAMARYNLGSVLARQGKLDEAIAEYSGALQSDPRLVEAYYNLGVALHRKGKPEEAIVYYSEALKIRPDWDRARRALQFAMGQTGKFTGHQHRAPRHNRRAH